MQQGMRHIAQMSGQSVTPVPATQPTITTAPHATGPDLSHAATAAVLPDVVHVPEPSAGIALASSLPLPVPDAQPTTHSTHTSPPAVLGASLFGIAVANETLRAPSEPLSDAVRRHVMRPR